MGKEHDLYSRLEEEILNLNETLDNIGSELEKAIARLARIQTYIELIKEYYIELIEE